MPTQVKIFAKILTFCLLISSINASAQEQKPAIRAVTSSYAIETGDAHIADTYLTPLHYRGWHAGFLYERTQPMRFRPESWIMQLKINTFYDHTENPAKSAEMLSGMVQGGWAMMHKWKMPHGLTLGFGPSTTLDIGILYMRRNSNNPASVKASCTLNASAFASYNGHIGKFNFTLRYQPTLPVTGVFFSPDYGELYYQIYLGAHDGLTHPVWWGNYFSLDNLLTADLHFGNTSLRLGYHNQILSTKVNDIVTQNITHALVIGVTTEWISLRPDSKDIDRRILSAY